MSSTNKTTNYNLSQFVGTDVPSYLGDYNGDMNKIDKAIGDVANSQGSVEQSVVGLTEDVQGLSTQVSGVSTSVQQLQTSVAQIDSAYKQADTALSQRITANANNIQTNTTAIEGINTTIGTEDISGIGDGTIKGAVSNLNSSLNNLYKSGGISIHATAGISTKKAITFNNPFPENTPYAVTASMAGKTYVYDDVFVGSLNRTNNGFELVVSNNRSSDVDVLIQWSAIKYTEPIHN